MLKTGKIGREIMNKVNHEQCGICLDQKVCKKCDTCEFRNCKPCIDKWYKQQQNSKCPMCKTESVTDINIKFTKFINIGTNAFIFAVDIINAERELNIDDLIRFTNFVTEEINEY